MSSGGKVSATRLSTAVFADGVTSPEGVVAEVSAKMSLPKFDVRQMMVFCHQGIVRDRAIGSRMDLPGNQRGDLDCR